METRMKKPQINFGPSLEGVMTWTKDRKRITEAEARKCLAAGDCEWSIPAWQEITAIVAAENMEKAQQ